jgi:hypothetical protein
MSEGPIKQWRDSFKVPRVSTPQSAAVHGTLDGRGRAYCGRKSSHLVNDWDQVTCADCTAARIADLKAAGVSER